MMMMMMMMKGGINYQYSNTWNKLRQLSSWHTGPAWAGIISRGCFQHTFNFQSWILKWHLPDDHWGTAWCHGLKGGGLHPSCPKPGCSTERTLKWKKWDKMRQDSVDSAFWPFCRSVYFANSSKKRSSPGISRHPDTWIFLEPINTTETHYSRDKYANKKHPVEPMKPKIHLKTVTLLCPSYQCTASLFPNPSALPHGVLEVRPVQEQLV